MKKKRHIHKHIAKTEQPKLTRYYDMRLLWLTIGLATAYIGIRYLLSLTYGVPLVNSWVQVSENQYQLVDHTPDYSTFEWVLGLFEMFAGLIIMCFFDGEPPHNGKDYRTEDQPGVIMLMNFIVMMLPFALICGNIWWWIGYITVMLLLSLYIGRYVGFGLPMGKEQVKHLLAAATDINVKYRSTTFHFRGQSSLVFVAISMIILLGVLGCCYAKL